MARVAHSKVKSSGDYKVLFQVLLYCSLISESPVLLNIVVLTFLLLFRYISAISLSDDLRSIRY